MSVVKSVRSAASEALAAGRLADSPFGALRLVSDFVTSRFLKWPAMPGLDQPRTVKMGGREVCYRFNRGDIQSIREVLVEEHYTLPFRLEVRTALDLGANIGLWSLWMHRTRRLERVVAVEPVRENSDLVRQNFMANHIPGEVIEAAVGPCDGSVRFTTRRESNLGSVLPVPGAESGCIAVRQVAMNTLVASFSSGVDLVKMDIEGAEGAVLTEGSGEWLPRVKALIIEWHEDRCDPAPLVAALESAGFRHFPANVKRQDNLSAFLRRDLAGE